MTRSPENHPHERASDLTGWDRVKWWWSRYGGRGYRDVWLLIITGLVLLALESNGDRVDDINATRATNLAASCEKSNEIATSVNNLAVVLQEIIITGALLPGDRPIPQNAPPEKWTGIDTGALSEQIESVAPAFPDADERLDAAQANAKLVQEQEVKKRDCAAEVESVEQN